MPRKKDPNTGRFVSTFKKTYAKKLKDIREAGDCISLDEIAEKMGVIAETLREWANQGTPETEKFSNEYRLTIQSLKNSHFRKMVNGEINPILGMFIQKTNFGAIEEDKRRALELREQELEAKINGDLEDTPRTIVFQEAPKPEEDANGNP